MKETICFILLTLFCVGMFYCSFALLRAYFNTKLDYSTAMMRMPNGEVLEVKAKSYDTSSEIVEATSEDGKTYFVHISNIILIRDKEEAK